MSDFATQIQQALKPLTDAERAKAMAAYMKGQFAFLGIQTPARRVAAFPLMRAFAGNPVDAARELWALSEREYQYVAVDLLRRQNKRLAAADLPALEALVQEKSWWDTVDGLTPTIGAIVAREPQLVRRMDALIESPDFWLRRIALLHQLDWKENTDEARLFAYCLHCADEREFFIRKAIGWALRQYARTNPAAVRHFLETNREKLSGLSFREAAKHL
ncbi:DNA alkylation repair protein [Ferribacterium limneticum]|uniref:DNA alkylation repair protein n=1 Tax=Ferribacterium limneticum TaxID=76259 RepID=UPI001CFA562F|nr:DNA alkylation repair protein [Ferribacterium limneticum]UCV20809.1 DNA alkylation repair protein [Ferribacterium limneticum]